MESLSRKNKKFKGHMRIQPKFLKKTRKIRLKSINIHRITMKGSMGILMLKNKKRNPKNLVKPSPNKN